MILGIDIGGTSCKLGIVKNGQVLARTRMDTTGHRDEHAFADTLVEIGLRLAQHTGVPLQAIGVGAPNGNQRTGCIDRAPNLPWARDIPLAAMLGTRTGLPCALGNDANAAALGEWRFGAGQGCSELLVVTLGTGLGSGFILEDRLLLGPFGNAGELGHMILVPGGRPCTCGRSGCLEAYVSIRGIRETQLEGGDRKKLLDEDGVLPIARAAAEGDKDALATFKLTAQWLAMGLANAMSIVPVQRIVLFGGIARSGDPLMLPLKMYFEQALLSIHKGRIELLTSVLPDDDSALLGAAALTTIYRKT